MATQAQVISKKAQAMKTQDNWQVAPRVNKNASIMASHLRDFTRINSPIFFGSMANEDPQEILDEVYEFK